jgi:hypothetical protein
MSPDAYLEMYFETWMRFDAAAMAKLYDHHARMEDPTLDQARVGRGVIERYYAAMFEELEQPEHALLDWATRRNRIWFEWTFANGGQSSSRVSYHGVSIQTLRDGLIVHDHAFWNPGG